MCCCEVTLLNRRVIKQQVHEPKSKLQFANLHLKWITHLQVRFSLLI